MLDIIYWVALAIGTYAAYVYFRDLGDITQLFLNVTRDNMLKAICSENKMVATGLGGGASGNGQGRNLLVRLD